MLNKLLLPVIIVGMSGIMTALEAPAPSAIADEAGTAQTPASAPSSSPSEKPRVFITDSQSWEVSGSGGGANGAFGSESQGGARPQTAEIIKTFGQRCPQVIVNNRQSLADYIVVLDHEGGKGLLRHKNKIAVFQRLSGDVVVSHSTLSLGGSVEDACKGISDDWQEHGAELRATEEKASAPHAVIVPMVMAPQQASAANTASVAIASTPSGADIEVDGGFVGSTPSTITLPAGNHEIVVKKKGFTDWSRKLSVTGGSVHLDADLNAVQSQ